MEIRYHSRSFFIITVFRHLASPRITDMWRVGETYRPSQNWVSSAACYVYPSKQKRTKINTTICCMSGVRVLCPDTNMSVSVLKREKLRKSKRAILFIENCLNGRFRFMRSILNSLLHLSWKRKPKGLTVLTLEIVSVSSLCPSQMCWRTPQSRPLQSGFFLLIWGLFMKPHEFQLIIYNLNM